MEAVDSLLLLHASTLQSLSALCCPSSLEACLTAGSALRSLSLDVDPAQHGPRLRKMLAGRRLDHLAFRRSACTLHITIRQG